MILTDFGLARFMNATTSIGTKTMLAGSPGYQSPEQLRAESTGPASDVYAFGGVVYVTISKTSLWPGLGHYQIMQKVTTNQVPNTACLPGCIKTLCEKCFSEKSKRPYITNILQHLQGIITCKD